MAQTGPYRGSSEAARDSLLLQQNPQPNNYTFAASDVGKHIFHDNPNAGSYVIPSNATVVVPVGAGITVVNNAGAGVITISIQGTDVLRRGDGTAGTGNRTVAANSVINILKTKPTEWMITGTFS